MTVEEKEIIRDNSEDLSIETTRENSDIELKEYEGDLWAKQKIKDIAEIEETINTIFLTGGNAEIDFDLDK